MNRLSLAQLTVNDACGPALVEAAAQAGFAAVGLRVISPAGAVQHERIAGNETLLREVESSLKATGLAVLDVNSFWITPQTTLADFLPVLEAGVRLQAPHVLVVIDDREIDKANARSDAKPVPTFADRASVRARAVFAQCCAAATQAGIRIALEFQPYGAVRSLAQAAAIVRETGPAQVGIVLDVLHLYRSGGTAADVATLPGEFLAFVQLCDALHLAPPPDQLRIESRGRRLYPGKGELPLAELMDVLPPGITLDVETPCARAATSDRRAGQAGLRCDAGVSRPLESR